MRRIYLDNAATSFPKPPEVLAAMVRYGTQVGASPGRGQYAESQEGAGIIRVCRERLAKFVGNSSPSNIVFALNTSDALNLAIKGVVRAERLRARKCGREAAIRLVTTAMDHNSVLRPFAALAEEGAHVEYVPCDGRTGLIDLAAWRTALRPTTASGGGGVTLAAINWVSNVTGTIQPVADAVGIAKQFGVPTLVDAAQGLGHLPFDQRAVGTGGGGGADLVAFPGHKGLLGPQGTGGLSIAPGFEDRIATTREGGTGSIAELDAQPLTMPERFEAGSHNTIGIAGLSEGVAWLESRGMHAVRAHELALIERTLEGFEEIQTDGQGRGNALRLIGPDEGAGRVGTFSFTHESLMPSEIAAILESEFGILARAGIHCAPLAHQTMGTLRDDEVFTRGAVRVSYGPFVTNDDVDALLHAIREICASGAEMTQP